MHVEPDIKAFHLAKSCAMEKPTAYKIVANQMYLDYRESHYLISSKR